MVNFASTGWAFTTAAHWDATLFVALAQAAEQHALAELAVVKEKMAGSRMAAAAEQKAAVEKWQREAERLEEELR